MGEDTTMRKIVIQTAATSIPLFIPLIVQNIVMDSDSLDKDQGLSTLLPSTMYM